MVGTIATSIVGILAVKQDFISNYIYVSGVRTFLGGLFSTAYVTGLSPASDLLLGNCHGDVKALGETGGLLQCEAFAEGFGRGQRRMCAVRPLGLSAEAAQRKRRHCRLPRCWLFL